MKTTSVPAGDTNNFITCECVDFIIDYFFNSPQVVVNNKSDSLYQNLINEIEKKFNLTFTIQTLQGLVDQARKEISQFTSPRHEKEPGRHEIYLVSVLRRSIQACDIKTEPAVLKEIAAVKGFYPDKSYKGEIIIKDFNPCRLTDRQLERICDGEDPGEVLMSPNE